MSEAKKKAIRGRGSDRNPAGRFERFMAEPFFDDGEEPGVSPSTQLIRDRTKTILTCNETPDIPYEAGVNPYRGCEHGCSYCYARAYHEYLGFSPGLDFETKILVKEDAPELLRRELLSPKWKPKVIGLSGVTDCYQPVERIKRLTRGCLEVLAGFRNPVCIVTKNHLVTRDVDLLSSLARVKAVNVFLSITTLNEELRRLMEPRTSSIGKRLEAVRRLNSDGVPTGVLIAPVIPGLTDHEIPAILERAAGAGARFAGYVLLRVPETIRPIFESWLENTIPTMKRKILERTRQVHGGNLSDWRFGVRMKGEGIFAEQISALFRTSCSRWAIPAEPPKLSKTAFRRPIPEQQTLF